MLFDDEHLQNIERAIEAGDLDIIDAARASYLAESPTGPVAAQHRVAHAMSVLFRKKDAEQAMELLRDAQKEKGSAAAKEATLSLSQLLFAKGKRQQAIFEVKKLAPTGAQPSFVSSLALDLLSMYLRDTQAPAADIIAVDEQRKSHLEALVSAADNGEDKASAMVRLACVLQDSGTDSDRARAKEKLDAVVRMGAAAGVHVERAKTLLKARAAPPARRP